MCDPWAMLSPRERPERAATPAFPIERNPLMVLSSRRAHAGGLVPRSLLAACIGVACAACAPWGAPYAPSVAVSADGGPTPDVVTVPNVGMIAGSRTATMRSFEGIPYAAPPVGPLRWKPPQKAAPLTGTLDATKFGSGCVQDPNAFGKGSTNEDCLFLNVYAPTGTGPYPVMFWIHGGAFLNGEEVTTTPPSWSRRASSRDDQLPPGNARVPGELAMDSWAGVASTNFGLLDQQFAMQWVQDNIASFGGDKTNVTIFGESAGGFSVHSQLVMPHAHGLFQKAIVESGAYGDSLQPTLATATTQGGTFATNAKCADPCTADALRALSTADVLAAQDALMLQTVLPSEDGTVIPTAGVGMQLSTGSYEKVPVIEGSDHDEWALFVGIYLNKTNMKLTTETGYETAAAATFGVSQATAMSLIAQYPLSSYMMDPAAALTAAGTDFVFACASRTAGMESFGEQTDDVYEFSDESAPELFLPVPTAIPRSNTAPRTRASFSSCGTSQACRP